ncbi:hypothetical protein [Crossiella sp. CA198]|uniref:hypothetical protein n=1 Tax=Crossiella sp. CA198 TaxID=3455607 RepID=UPI003F8D79AC
MTDAEVDLFGNPVTSTSADRPAVAEPVNDLAAVVKVLDRAAGALGYAVVGRNNRVQRYCGKQLTTWPVTGWEAAVIAQLLHSGVLTLGAPRVLTCGAVTSKGSPVLVPGSTRRKLTKWEEELKRNPHAHGQHPTPDKRTSRKGRS